MPELDGVVIAAVIFFAVAFTGLATLSGLAGDENLTNSRALSGEPVFLNDAGIYTTIDDSVGQDETVYNSLGYAVELTGSNDSFVQTSSSFVIADDDTWTVAVWGFVDAASSGDNMAAVSANGRVVISYDGAAGNWSAWYYDEGSTDSYIVNVSAVDQPGNLTSVIVVSNATHLAIYRNNTVGDVKDITGSNIASAPVSSTNWHGRLDELRTFDDALSSSQRQQLVDSPVDPLAGTNRTSRVMFDKPGDLTQLVFFAPTSLEQSNVSFTDGLAGSVMDGKTFINDITGETDYVWDDDGPRIYVVDGGELDAAPVAYVDYTFYPFGGAQRSFTDGIVNAISTAAIIPVVMLLVVLLGYLTLLRDR